jgi:TolB protein
MRFSLILLSVLAVTVAPVAPVTTASRAQVSIDVNQGIIEPLPIAVPSFVGAGPYGSDIARVVAANLERSGYFRIVPGLPAADVSATPQLATYRSGGAQALVAGRAVVGPDGRLQTEFRLWDTALSDQLLGQQFVATPDNWRRVAHKISDAIYARLTGAPGGGYFDTRVVFVAESGPKDRRIKRLAIMDQDGATPQYLTQGDSIVTSPRFSANSQEIVYMAIKGGRSRIYLFNIETGRQETLGEFPGLVYAPRFSPDGQRVAFAAERNGNSDIYVMDLRTRQSRRLTTDPGIDTSPSFSPDGQRIAFNSDRSGNPRIWIMNADGSAQRPIAASGGRYSTPVWAPRGNLIAFTRQAGGQFGIGVINADGTGERMLTSSYLDEGPTWSPNGRVIMFSRESGPGGESKLYSVDISGRNLRPAGFPGGATDPAWSPMLN